MKKVKLATVWLDGCSGCHMSLLDMDAGVIALAGKVDIVYGPLVDAQEFPDGVDVTLVEGAVSSMEDLHKIQRDPAAHQPADRAGRLRGDQQRPLYAQLGAGQQAAAAGLRRRHGRGQGRARRLACRRCWPRRARSTSLSRWTCFCPAARRPPRRFAGLVTDLLEGRKPEANPKVKFG